MGVQLDHTIVWCHDERIPAAFLTAIPGLAHLLEVATRPYGSELPS